MDKATTGALQNAYALIKVGRQQDALAILIPVVKQDPNIADAWYLLGFALTDPQKRLQAFQQVLRIDPANQAAQRQIAKIRAAQAAAPAEKPAPSQPAFFQEAESKPVAAPRHVQDRTGQPPAPTPLAGKKKKVDPRLVLGLVAAFIAIVCIVIGIQVWKWSTSTGLPAMDFFLPLRPLPTFTPGPSPTPRPTIEPSPTPLFTPVFRSGACPFDVPLGKRIRCGIVSVPQNREKNFTNLIELPVVVYESSKPNADVIIYLQGGPGIESLDWAKAMYDSFVTPLLDEYDVVFFDPRGTGRSEPRLDCPELNAVFIDAYYQNRPEEDAFRDFTDAWSKCHERFVAEGVDPSAFNTTQGAADVRDIAQALGYNQVNLLGISYGTRLGLTVMRDYPEIVRAAVLDSVVPMQAKMFNRRASDVDYVLKKVFADCASSPNCNSVYPDLENVFNTLVKRFDEKPVAIKAYDPSSGFTSEVKVNGVDMLSAVVWGLHTSELVPVIPKAIYDIQNGDYTFLSFALGVPGGEYSSTGLGTYFATVCPEQVYASTPEEVDADLNLSPLLKRFSLAGLFGSSERVFQLCDAWGAKPHDPRDSEPVKANIPTLVLSGEYDPTTPSTTGQMVSDDLPNDYFYIVPGLGHGASTNKCALGMVKSFLADPAQAPNSICLVSMESFDFFLPYNGGQPIDVDTVIETGHKLRGVGPVRWEKTLPSGFYFRKAYLFDPTQVGYISVPGRQAEVLAALKTSFASSGFDQAPKKTTTRSANGYSWTIYQSSYNGEPVFVALTEAGWRTMVVIMVVSAPEKDAFYEGLFLPMVDAAVPTE